MDHPCHKCGHSTEDGKAFCSECGAPQIRVTISEASPELAFAGDKTAVVPPHEVEPVALGIPGVSLPARWSHTVKPCALAATAAFVLTAVRLNPFAAALGAGFLAVALSRRRNPVARIGAGARLGALAGLLFFGILTTLDLFAVAVLHKGAEIRNEMVDALQQAATRYPGAAVQPFLDLMKSPGGFAILVAASLIAGLVAFVVLGSVGGALGATLLGRNNRP